jgi:hypothetical protein
MLWVGKGGSCKTSYPDREGGDDAALAKRLSTVSFMLDGVNECERSPCKTIKSHICILDVRICAWQSRTEVNRRTPTRSSMKFDRSCVKAL